MGIYIYFFVFPTNNALSTYFKRSIKNKRKLFPNFSFYFRINKLDGRV